MRGTLLRQFSYMTHDIARKVIIDGVIPSVARDLGVGTAANHATRFLAPLGMTIALDNRGLGKYGLVDSPAVCGSRRSAGARGGLTVGAAVALLPFAAIKGSEGGKMKATVVTMSLALVILTSCKKADEVATGSAETATAATTSEIAGTQSPNDLNPVRAQAFIDDVTMGHEVAADGTIPAGKTGDDFAPGETVHIAMKVKDAPANTAVKVVFFGPGEKNVGEETKNTTAGQTFASFDKATKGWPKGDYRADVWVGDEKVNTQHFQIVDAKKAGK